MLSETSGQCCVVFIVLSVAAGTAIPQGPIVSPLTYRRAFKINIPLKPKFIQRLHSIYKKKNLSAKRDTKHAHYYRPRHVPFIKSIGVLFDDILNRHKDIAGPQGNEPTITDKVRKFHIEPLLEHLSAQHDSEAIADPEDIALDERQPDSEEKQTTASSTRTPETTSHSANTTKASLDRAIPAEVSDPNFTPITSQAPLPTVSSANTTAGGRTYERHTHGSGPTDNGDDKRDVPGNSGRAENVSQISRPGNLSKSISEHTEGTPRDSANSSISDDGSTRKQGDARLGYLARRRDNSLTETDERARKIGAGIKQSEVEDKIKDGGNNIKSDRKGYGRRIRGHHGTIKKYVDEQSVQPSDNIDKSIVGDAQSGSSDKQKLGENSTATKQNEISGARDLDLNHFVINLGNITGDVTKPINPIEILSGYSNYTIEHSRHP